MSFCFSFQERKFLSISNYVFTVIFVAEMTVKVWYSFSLYIRSIHSTKHSYRCDMDCVKGGGPRLLRREAKLSAEYLECSGRGAGLGLSH